MFTGNFFECMISAFLVIERTVALATEGLSTIFIERISSCSWSGLSVRLKEPILDRMVLLFFMNDGFLLRGDLGGKEREAMNEHAVHEVKHVAQETQPPSNVRDFNASLPQYSHTRSFADRLE